MEWMFKMLSTILHLGNIKLSDKNGIVEIKDKTGKINSYKW